MNINQVHYQVANELMECAYEAEEDMAALSFGMFLANAEPDGNGGWMTSLPMEFLIHLQLFTETYLDVIPQNTLDRKRVEVFARAVGALD